MRHSGFTLIEFTIVLILLGILSLTINLSPNQSGASLRAEAEMLISELRRIQFLAISGNKKTKVSFTSTSYSSFDITNNSAILNTRTGQTSVSLPSTFNLSSSSLPNNMLAFDSQGAPFTNDYSNKLTQTAIITLMNGSNVFQIEITPFTGKIKLL